MILILKNGKCLPIMVLMNIESEYFQILYAKVNSFNQESKIILWFYYLFMVNS